MLLTTLRDVRSHAIEQIVGRERRERLSQLAWCGAGCFDSRRRVNSNVMSLSDSFEDVLRREQLHFAAADGDVEKVTRLLNDGHQPNVFDELGKTPLHYAA